MLGELTLFVSQLNETAKSNPILAAALSIYGLGVLTFLLRNVPTKLFGFIKTQCTTTLTFDNSAVGTNQQNYVSFLKWFGKQGKWVKFSRSISLNGHGNYWEDTAGTQTGIGNGNHFLLFKGRPCWIQRTEVEKVGADRAHFRIVITMLGRNHQLISDLIDAFKYVPDAKLVGIYDYMGDKNWARVADINPRKLETVIVRADTKLKIQEALNSFKTDKQWYLDRGFPHKLTVLLHGIPGAGKTSLIKAFASSMGFNICKLNMSRLTDTSLENALITAPANSIILMEDFDSAGSTHARRGMKKDATNGPTLSEMMDLGGLTLSGILNALDGVVSLEDKVIFMTTNVIDDLDPALLRSGRVDHIIELGALEDPEIREYAKLMFKDVKLPNVRFSDIPGSDLQKLFLENRGDADAFVRSIPFAQELEQSTLTQLSPSTGEIKLGNTIHTSGNLRQVDRQSATGVQ